MTNIETPDYDIDHETYSERGESMVKTITPVRVTERVENDIDHRYDADTKPYGDSFKSLRWEAEWVETDRLGNSLVNLDAYLRDEPNHIVDAPSEWTIDGANYASWHNREVGDREAARSGWPEMKFELYENELIEAAKQRALEDASHHVRVLAAWMWLAFPGGEDDRYNRRGMGPLRSALQTEANTHPDVHWALAYGGDPDKWRHDQAPVGYVPDGENYDWERELRAYEGGGYDFVFDREERNDDA